MKKLCVSLILLITLSIPALAEDENQEATLQGYFGTHLIQLAVDDDEVMIAKSDYITIQLTQTEVHGALGQPSYTFWGESDVYIYEDMHTVVYYNIFGKSAMVLYIPHSL